MEISQDGVSGSDIGIVSRLTSCAKTLLRWTLHRVWPTNHSPDVMGSLWDYTITVTPCHFWWAPTGSYQTTSCTRAKSKFCLLLLAPVASYLSCTAPHKPGALIATQFTGHSQAPTGPNVLILPTGEVSPGFPRRSWPPTEAARWQSRQNRIPIGVPLKVMRLHTGPVFYGDPGNAGRIMTTRCEWSLKESTIHQSHYVPHNMMY